LTSAIEDNIRTMAVGRTSFVIKTVNLAAVVLPLVGVVVACILLWGWGFSWVHLGLLLGMYLVTGLGITIGYHRLFTHRAFQTNNVMKSILAICGSMAVEGPVLKWVADHRRHHQHSDHEEDPHSPHLHGHGFVGFFQGLWHAHVGWVFKPDAAGLYRYVGDLKKDPIIRAMHKLFPLWVLLGLLIPAVLGGLLTLSWSGVLLGFIWGGLVRVGLVHHITWSVNSVCHLWGSKNFRSDDESRNNAIVGILAFGEGWHNNHHAFPTSARHGLAWWQVDVSYILIKGMEMVGLAYNVRVPSQESIQQKRIA